MSTRVLVVDDTALFRRIIGDALAAVPGVEIAGTAANGKMALARLASLRPDLMTLDIEMPEMDGIEVLQAMSAAGLDTGVIVLSARTAKGGELTTRALELGAFDFLTKPDGGDAAANLAWLRAHLLPMIRAFERRAEIRGILRGNSPESPQGPSVPLPPASAIHRRGRTGAPLVLVAVSTGGPAALARLLPALPADLGAPVFIVQHMPALFTQPLAASLAAKSAIRVKEAADGETAAPNCVYLAPGGKQMKLAPGGQGEILVRITDDPAENNCKPAADYLFRSAALHFPGRAVAAILTGMGNDGTAGLRMLKRSGCLALAQDEASCVVFGMPKEAIAAGLVDDVLPLETIAATIIRSVREARR
jgi:two-component system, chemotaxis family, protein-glutamate methylesterase/glutaminase